MNPIPIIYEDSEIIVINKPAGLAVQGGAGIKHSLDKDFPLQINKDIYLVHRLDKETAGLMIVAKSPLAASKWTRLINSGFVKKEYSAFCIGIPQKSSDTIRDSIESKGKSLQAVTHYNCAEKYTVKVENESFPDVREISFSRLNLSIDTGRMHQIRIHLANLKLPILGDDKHGDFKMNKICKKLFGVKNLFLLSKKLYLGGKNDKNMKCFEIEDPEYFKKIYTFF